ncbi:MAG TPA: hypothetical protein VGP08_16075 [Pyrinomonadaceae bacterium]|jgi:hypothetical protein|nr:hypothetical protein [Pyrinomonadaceae bacterium]
MSSFVPRAIPPTLAEPDPTKHVKYTLGMVLGVDDFTQEFAYLSGRDRWLARDLLGYGTASGLRVGVEIENRSPQVVVTPGAAVSPSGQLIRVAPVQCADLNLWLAARHEELRQRLSGASGNRALLRLYLVLCYRDCATDMVPIPGEPCRSQDETMAPSRLADDFKLELRYESPGQREEDALRDFVEWLGQVEVTDEPGSFSTLEELEKAIRDAARAPSSPPSPPDFFYGSPPEALRIHPSMAYEYLRAAFRLWTTELRPNWHGARGDNREVLQSSAAAAGDEDCVLLAEVSVPLARNTANTIWQVEDATRVELHEERRPYLVHLRMLQELVVSGRRAGGGATSGGASIGPAFGVTSETSYGLQPNPGKRFDYARADHTHGTPAAPVLAGDVTGPVNSTTVASIRNREVLATAPAEGQVLTFTGGKWQPAAPAAGTGTGTGTIPKPATTVTAETSFGLNANGGTSVDYARADHTHGTPPAPTLAGDVTGTTGATNPAKVVAIQNVAVDATKPTTTGQLLGFDAALNRWKPVSPPAGTVTNLAGDVTGTTGASTVIAIRNTPVDPTKPTTGQFLGFDAPTNSWKPLAPPSATPAATNTVTRSTSLAYSIVAAGLVTAAKGATSNSYNNLRVTSVSDGIITMVFDNYQQPPASGATQQYIVKVLPVLPGGVALNDLTVVFGGFGDNATGFTLIVNNAGARVVAATLASLSFMVEVSQFDMKVFGTTTSKATKETKETETKAVKDTEVSKAVKDTDVSSSMPAGASPSSFAAAGAVDGDAASEGRAFIVGEERPEVGRAAFDLADKQDDKLPESGATGKQAEAFN